MTSRTELQELVVATMKGSVDLMTLISGVYDNVPKDAWGDNNGYVSLGAHQKLRDDADCIRTGEHFVTIDAWSRRVGKNHAQAIVDEIEALFLDSELELTVNALVLTDVERTDVFKDPDGLTTHGVVVVKALIEEH